MTTRKRLLIAILAALAVLGATATEVLGSGSSITQRGHLAPVTGTIAGTFNVAGGPAKKRPPKHIPAAYSHAVLVQRTGKTVKVAHTNSRGRFFVRIAPGTYSLKGTVGADCQTKTVRVEANKMVRVTIGCSIM